MTVKELIEELKKLPQDLEVLKIHQETFEDDGWYDIDDVETEVKEVCCSLKAVYLW